MPPVQSVEFTVLGGSPVDDREIALLHAMRFERRLEPAQRRLRLRDGEAARGLFVEAVHDPRPQLAADSGQIADLVKETVDDRARRNTGARMHCDPSGFVDDDEIGVLVQHGEIETFRDQLRWSRCSRKPNLDFAVDRRSKRRLRRFSGDGDGTLVDELPQPRARQLGHTRGEQLIETASGVRGFDAHADELHQIFDLM
jgi:hypothetical protein